MATRKELIQAVRRRYESAPATDKRLILDEFVALTGYHRKYAIRKLGETCPEEPVRRERKRIYKEVVGKALLVFWEASDRLCGKRLKALLPILIEAMSRQGHLQLDPEVERLLLAASAATIDRLLKPTRGAVRGKRRESRMSTAIRKAVPVRTFADWHDPKPGYCEADFVAHCGGVMSGRFLHSLVFTDIASGWTESIPLLVREQSVVVDAIRNVRQLFPVPLLGLDTDNDGAFINQTMIDYCEATQLEFTRSRPYRKNDQAWIEQKNGAIVRRLVGYGRLEGRTGAQALGQLYAAARLYVNYFQPSFKLQSKIRNGSKIIKKYHSPKTPCQRLLESTEVDPAIKARLQRVFVKLDPVNLLSEIRRAQQVLADLVAGDSAISPCSRGEIVLKEFLSSLSTAWKEGEVRPTHRRKHVERHWRTRQDPFEFVWVELETWLEQEPDMPGKELFHRLQRCYPNIFPDSQLRTLQRRVQAWRAAKAQQLLFFSPAAEFLTSANFAEPEWLAQATTIVPAEI